MVSTTPSAALCMHFPRRSSSFCAPRRDIHGFWSFGTRGVLKSEKFGEKLRIDGVPIGNFLRSVFKSFSDEISDF